MPLLAKPLHSWSLKQTFHPRGFDRKESSCPQRYQLPRQPYPHRLVHVDDQNHNLDALPNQMPRRVLFVRLLNFYDKKHWIPQPLKNLRIVESSKDFEDTSLSMVHANKGAIQLQSSNGRHLPNLLS